VILLPKTPIKSWGQIDIIGPYRECRERCCVSSRWKSNPRNCQVALVATWEAQRVTNVSKPQGHRSTFGGSASVRAATRAKPEQASKAVTRGSSRPDNGEDQWRRCGRTAAHGRTRRGIGRSTYTGPTTQRGRSVAVQGSPLQLHDWWRLGQKVGGVVSELAPTETEYRSNFT